MSRQQPEQHHVDAPMLGNDSYGGQENVVKMFFERGCFNHSPCPKCGAQVRLTTFSKTKANPDGTQRRCVTATLRCKNKACQKTISPFSGTIWAEVNDRQLFLFVVGQFLGRCTVHSMAESTGAKEETISKYVKIIKNALYLENEAEKQHLKLGSRGSVVQGDETRVFSRKYNVGRVLAITEHGWLFGIVEDCPDGRIWIEMVKDRSGERLQNIIINHTEDSAIIFTDCWKAYDGLEAKGVEHNKVNHKENIVSHQRRHVDEQEEEQPGSDDAEDDDDLTLIDDTIDVHTNKIERAWREIKRGLANQPIRLLSRNIGVEMFRYNNLNGKIPFGVRRDLIITTIAKHQAKIEQLLRESFPVYPEE